eukprot:851530_1
MNIEGQANAGFNCHMCRGRINANIEDQIFDANNDGKWQEDVPDDEPESKVNDVDAITIRIAPTVSVSDPKATHTIVLELTASTIKGPDLWDICAVLNVSGSMCSSAAVQEEDKQCLAIRRERIWWCHHCYGG